jgi:hypothetical protein
LAWGSKYKDLIKLPRAKIYKSLILILSPRNISVKLRNSVFHVYALHGIVSALVRNKSFREGLVIPKIESPELLLPVVKVRRVRNVFDCLFPLCSFMLMHDEWFGFMRAWSRHSTLFFCDISAFSATIFFIFSLLEIAMVGQNEFQYCK